MIRTSYIPFGDKKLLEKKGTKYFSEDPSVNHFMTLASSLKITIVLLYHKVSFHTTSSLTDNKDRQQRMALIKELETLIQVGRHPNIVSLVGACTFEGKGSAIQKVTANVGGQVVSMKVCVAEMEIRFNKKQLYCGCRAFVLFR